MVRAVHPQIVIAADVPVEWEELIQSFRRSLKAENRTPGTIAVYTRYLRELARFLVWQEMPLAPSQIRRSHLEAFMGFALERLKGNSALTRYAALHVFFGWLEREDEIAVHPMLKMKRPKVEVEPNGVLSEADIRALLRTCAGKSFEARRDTAMIRLLLDTGLRRGELAGILVGDLDLGEQEVTVLGKGQRTRVVAFGAKAAQALDSYKRVRARHAKAADPHLFLGRRGPYTGAGIRFMLRQRAQEAGLAGADDMFPHLFRHTFADQSIARGKSESYVMEQGGWRSETVMRRYGAGNRARRARKSFKEESIGDAF